MIEITCGIPIRDMGDIAWLQVESLINQEDTGGDWELIIMEDETDNKFVLTGDMRERLDKAGCRKVQWIDQLERETSLCDKWAMMGELASKDSKMFHLCGADDWSPATRLLDSLVFRENFGADIVQYLIGNMYDFARDEVVRFDARNCQTRQFTPMTGHHISLRTEYMRNLPVGERLEFGHDTWVQNEAWLQDANITKMNLANDRGGVCTTGRNLISNGRLDMIRARARPYREHEHGWQKNIGYYVGKHAERLRELGRVV